MATMNKNILQAAAIDLEKRLLRLLSLAKQNPIQTEWCFKVGEYTYVKINLNRSVVIWWDRYRVDDVNLLEEEDNSPGSVMKEFSTITDFLWLCKKMKKVECRMLASIVRDEKQIKKLGLQWGSPSDDLLV